MRVYRQLVCTRLGIGTHSALIGVIRSPEVRARLLQAGAEVQTSTPAELSTFITLERKRWSGVIERAGKQLEGTI